MTAEGTAFGSRLSACRRSSGLSQAELAERSGLSIRAISNLERGRTRRPHPDSVHRLADALGLPVQSRAEFVAAAGRRLGGVSAEAAAANPADRLAQAGDWRGASVVPRQLPTDVRHFVGRAGVLTALSAVLSETPASTGAAAICVIDGSAGVGKTTLAVHWAHQVADRFPDGQLFVNLRGFDPSLPPVTAAEAIRGFLADLQVPEDRVPASTQAQANLYRSLLAGKHMLIVLDNARDAGQVRPLLPATHRCAVLVTSRSQLTSLVAAEGAQPVSLRVLSEQEARDLLASRLGAQRLACELDAAGELIRLCGRLPLALSIVAAQAAMRPGRTLASAAAYLRRGRGRLDALDAGDQASSVRAAFSWSYFSLGPATARLFRLVGLHPGPDITAPAAGSLAAIPREQAQRSLTELSRANLLTEHSPGRYACHDLLHVYAAERTSAEETATERRTAACRMLDHYLRTAGAAVRVMYPAADPVALCPPQPGVEPEHLQGNDQALAWLTAEYSVLLAVITDAARGGLDTYAQELPDVLATFLDRTGRWRDCVATQRISLAAAERRHDLAGQARAHRFLGRALTRLRGKQDAYAHLTLAMELFRAGGDHVGQARSHLALALADQLEGRWLEALRHAEQALPLYRAARHRPGEATALTSIGLFQALAGRPEQALAFCHQGLDLNRELSNPGGMAEAWAILGYASHELGRYAEAIACYRQALALARELGQPYTQADVLKHLGDTHKAAGGTRAAVDCWHDALALLDGLHHPEAASVRAKLASCGTPQAATGAVAP
jgi:transcriptional regulator with XRE-family HTH domain/tetratricopeptide (TPR) repeat protein